jgi:hypothetical protein
MKITHLCLNGLVALGVVAMAGIGLTRIAQTHRFIALREISMTNSIKSHTMPNQSKAQNNEAGDTR